MFRTTNMPFAAFLLTTKKLTFKGKDAPKGNSTLMAFLFDDPNDEGDMLEAEFLVSAFNSYYEAIKALRTMMHAPRF